MDFSPFDQITVVCIGSASVIMAVNQSLKDAPAIKERWPKIGLGGWWNYLPLAFMIVAGVFWLVPRMLGPHSHAVLPLPPSANQSADTTASTDSGPKVEGVPLRYIYEAFDGRTEAEAMRIVQPYLGHPVTVSAVVYDVSEGTDGNVSIAVQRLALPAVGNGLFLHVAKESRANALVLRKNDHLQAKCVVGRIDDIGISFDDCVIMNPIH